MQGKTVPYDEVNGDLRSWLQLATENLVFFEILRKEEVCKNNLVSFCSLYLQLENFISLSLNIFITEDDGRL